VTVSLGLQCFYIADQDMNALLLLLNPITPTIALFIPDVSDMETFRVV